MKIRINYDFFNRIKEAKEDKPTVFTIIRTKKKQILFEALMLGMIDAIGVSIEGLSLDLLPHLFIDILLVCSYIEIEYLFALFFTNMNGCNENQLNAKKDLLMLIQLFSKLNLSTDYDLLLETEIYKKEYKVKFNDSGIPYILEKKFYNVPAYSFNNEVKERSVCQEHVLGSQNYDLSLDEPTKKLKLVLAN